MPRRPTHLPYVICLCTVLVAPLAAPLTGCTSTPEPKPEGDDQIEFTPKRRAPERPEYHAEPDAELLKTPESRALVQASCAVTEEPEECRQAADRRLLGYRGAFSAPGANEILVGVGPSAVLLTEEMGQWTVVARAPDVDIDRCLVSKAHSNTSPNELVCRATTAAEWGHSLTFFRLGYVPASDADADADADKPRLEVSPLDTPRATDVDTALFAGWKHAREHIEIRFHRESKVHGTTQVNFSGTDTCRYRTFGFERTPEPTLVELDGCHTGDSDAPKEESRSNYATYDGQLEQPVRNRNRAFAMCYQAELDRLAALAEAEDEAEEQAEPQELAAGDVHTRFVVGSTGAPVSCEVAKSTLRNDNVEQCLCREVMNTAFPPVPEGKFVDVTYPFSFAPPAQ